MQSACRALETAIEQGHRSVEVKTDSTYTIKGELCMHSHVPSFYFVVCYSNDGVD